MKQTLSCFLLFLFSIFFKDVKAQVFWTETFGVGCTQGNLAAGSAPTASNGAWTVANGAGLANGSNPNEWFISSTEAGMGTGNCGDGCLNNATLTNRTLHIGSNLAGFVDLGAAYLAGAPNFNTNKRAESPTINCTGFSNITLSLKYLVEGVAGVDYAELVYSANNGGTWAVLAPLPTTANGGCLGQGLWTAFSTALPASANNNATVKIGVRWESSDPTGADPSIAVDDIELATVALNFTVPATACANQSVQATVTGTVASTTSYSWTSTPAGAVFAPATSSAPAVTFPSGGTYTITLSALNGATILGTVTQTISVTQPTVTVTPSSQTICAGNTATLTANATSGATYQWATGTFPGITLLGTNSTQTVNPAVTTSYSVLVTVNSCTAFATSTVFIGSSLSINASSSATQVCTGASATLSATGATSYTWASPSNTNIGTTASVVVNPTVNTTYTVTGENSGCTGTQTISIATTSNVTYTLAATAATVCPGQTVGLTATGGVNYTWSPGGSLSTTSGSATTAAPLVQTTYSVIGNDGAGCSGSGNITIYIGGAPALAVASTASAVCAGYSSTLTASGASSYTWTGTTLTVAINQSSIAVGPGTYTLMGSTGAACSGQTVVTVASSPPLNVMVSQNTTTTCIAYNSPKFSKPVTLTASGASTYNWFPCNQYISICIGPVVNVRPPTSTCYTVTGNTSVCSGSAVVCVTVVPQYTVSVTPPLPIMCVEDSLKLCVANIGSVSVSPYSYVWTEPANAPPPTLDNPYAPCVRAFPSNTISTGLTYTTEVFDARGCVSVPKLVTVTVIPRPLTTVTTPSINGVPTNTICFVKNTTGVPDVTLTLTASNNNGLPPQFDPTYTWVPTYTTPAGPILTPNPTNGPTSTVIVSAPKRTPELMTYTVISGFNGIPGCRREDTVTIRVIDCRFVDTIAISSSPNDTICTRQCITYNAETDTLYGGPQTYTWTFQGGNPMNSNLKNPTVCYNIPGTYNVTLRVANPYPKHITPTGSALTKGYFQYVKVVDIPNTRILPQINFPNSYKDTIIRFGSSIVLTATNALSYVWRPNYKISGLTGPVVTVGPLQTTEYIVTGYNSKGCAQNDTINVIVVEDCGEMYVPNAFSPNNDGSNDILYVRGQCLETLTFMVFNRWGEKVFESNDQKVGWDGTYKGELMNTGVFVFRVEGKTYDGKAYSMKGNVTLVR